MSARRRIKRIDGRTKAARRVKQLIADYTRRLGLILIDKRYDGTLYANVLRLAEMETLAETMRAAALNGEAVDIAGGLIRIENAVRRLKMDLGLEKPPPPPPSPATLDEYLDSEYSNE
jgi:hypothetical protein